MNPVLKAREKTSKKKTAAKKVGKKAAPKKAALKATGVGKRPVGKKKTGKKTAGGAGGRHEFDPKRFLPKRRRNIPDTARRPAAERIGPILEILDEAYPVAECALHHENALELLVATILSAQCTDEMVNKVTANLFKKYRTAADYAAADPAVLEVEIKSTGFFRNKTKSLIGMGKALVANHGGEVPQTMEELLKVPGAARKTSNVVLGTAFGIPSGVVVDTHVGRISQRLGLTRHTDPVRIENDLMKLLPQERWIRYSHQIIHHGRQICMARNPQCLKCPLNELCPSADFSAADGSRNSHE